MKEYQLDESDGIPEIALQEIALLRELSHPNIVSFVDASHEKDSSTIGLIMPLAICDFEDVLDACRHSEQGRPFPLSLLRPIASQLLSGLEYLHAHRYVHGDVAPSNVALFPAESSGSNGLQCRLCWIDFSLSGGKITSVAYRLPYRAPELVLPSSAHGSRILAHASPATDCWALGHLLVACLFPMYRVYSHSCRDISELQLQLHRLRDKRSLWVKQVNQAVPALSDGAAREVLLGLTDCDVHVRMTAREACESVWLQDRAGCACLPWSVEDVKQGHFFA
jgi:serine/threonine protein kinase